MLFLAKNILPLNKPKLEQINVMMSLNLVVPLIRKKKSIYRYIFKIYIWVLHI